MYTNIPSVGKPERLFVILFSCHVLSRLRIESSRAVQRNTQLVRYPKRGQMLTPVTYSERVIKVSMPNTDPSHVFSIQ